MRCSGVFCLKDRLKNETVVHLLSNLVLSWSIVFCALADLYGLLLFLGVEPYWVQHWWNTLLLRPYHHGVKTPLYSVVSRVMWRTAKKDVLDQVRMVGECLHSFRQVYHRCTGLVIGVLHCSQICLPTQTEEIHWLTFSPVEEHFYRKQYHQCASDARKVTARFLNISLDLGLVYEIQNCAFVVVPFCCRN